MIHSTQDFIYHGIFDNFFWNKELNPNATVPNGLANCTTMAYGLTIMEAIGDVDAFRPVSRIASAMYWHKYLINGWTFIPYDREKVNVGDIIEWVDHCHVAKVIARNGDKMIVGSSFYTGEHGKAYYDGGYDTRSFSSLEELSDFMYENYPWRFYHEQTIEDESRSVGGEPQYILVKPYPVLPVEEDTSVNQIYVYTNEQNIRNNANDICGVARMGYYNVIGTKVNNGYIWYEVQPDRYIAGVKGRVEFIPAITEYDKLRAENAELKADMQKIMEIAKRWM